MGMGKIARRRGRREDALLLFERAATVPSASAWSTIEWSKELLDAGQSGEAARVLISALARLPAEPLLHIQLGQVARATGDRVTARAAFNGRLLPGGRKRATVELALVEFDAGHSDLATTILENLLIEDPTNVAAIETLAGIAQQLDDLETSILLRCRANQIDRSNKWSRLQLIQAFTRLGRSQEAETEMTDFENSFGSTPELLAQRAKIAIEAGDYRAAETLLQTGGD